MRNNRDGIIITILLTILLIVSVTGDDNDDNVEDILITSLPEVINDSSPPPFKFSYTVYNVSIPENSVGRTYATQPPNEDRLGIRVPSANFDVKYRIIAGDKDKLFKAEERLVGDFAFLTIRTRTGNVILNREKIDEYRLTIRGTGTQHIDKDNKETYETDTNVVVKVLDRNDLSPLFYPTEYATTVPEDTPLYTSLLRVNAEDADLGINGEIYYSFFKDTDYFAIHPTTGVITLTRHLKFTDKSLHELTVIATDRGSGSQPNRLSQASKAKVKIRVRQVNLYVPEIFVQALPDILENSNYANIYGIVRVEDRDIGIHGQIKSLDIVDGDPDGHFRIKQTNRPGEFNIEVHRLLDREKTPQGYNLTLRAIDRGIPPHQSYKVVPVHLADINDNIPVFNKEIYEVSIPETSPPNSPVIRLKVTDRDVGKNAVVSLEIVGGNEGGEFRINPETGMLYTTVALDAETKVFYTLTVSAIDQGNSGTRKQSSAKVKINVQDTNDNDPVFEYSNQTIWIDENEPAGTKVIKVTARDADSGENAYISYSIANINAVPFDIDHFSGQVHTSKLIDYETMRREYVLRVRASDWGLPYRRQREMQLIIKIRDVNDNRPQFERIDCVGSIGRGTPIGTDIITMTAIDFDANSFINYRIVAGNEDGCFNLDPTIGTISIGCDLSDVRVEHRDLNITATDGTHYSDVNTIRINLIQSVTMSNDNLFECRDTGVIRRQSEIFAAAERSNDPNYNRESGQDDFPMMPSRYGENIHTPEFTEFPLVLQINETTPLGTTVAWIKARDRDLGYNGKLVYGISDGDHDSVFRLDPDNGDLKIIGYLDREREDEYVLNVTVYDLGKPQKSISKVLPITILDENDNAPKFERTLASFRVTENALNGTIIYRLNATDADIGDNARVTYTLITDTKDFMVDPITGVLTVHGQLDRERQELYELRIRASDGGAKTSNGDGKTLYSDAIVRIIVEDINDNAPEFNLNDYMVRIREDVPRGTMIAVVSATDLDSGPGGEITYEIIDDAMGERPDASSFKIDKLTGTIRSVKQLDFEEQPVHSLVVRASDAGTPSLTAETRVIIEVIDVNENRFAPQFSDFVLVGSVMENKPSGTHVMTVEATDADSPGPDSRITYSIRGGDGLGIFTIDNEGKIHTLAVLDLESKSHYWLTVCAQDQAVVPLHSCVQVYIKVLNENDNVPLTESAVYYPSIPENSPAGEKVLQLIAEDRDDDPLHRISYRINSGNPEGYFAINTSSGLITTTTRKLDRENQPEHILEVAISDNGIPPLSSTTRVVVTVSDINDHAPEFDQKFYKIQVPSNVQINQSLFQVHADDLDIGENGRITYTIKSGKNRAKPKFRIDSDTGVVYAAKPYDINAEYDLVIRAEDNGAPKKSQTTVVKVIIVPVPTESLHSPQIKNAIQHAEVTENDSSGFLVALFQADDKDDDRLWYNITAGDPKNDFYIDRESGNVFLARKLDWETQNEYNLTISVTDGVYLVNGQLIVTVLDVNDHRPEFTEPIYRIDISESVEEGTEVLQLHATDLDEDKKLFYSLHAARDPISLKLFRVDSVSGSITLTQPLDRETIAEHVLIVIVKDQGTPAKRNYAKVIVTVHDHNDHAPEFTTKIIQGKIYETAAIGSQVAQVYAIDRDIGDNARISYSIVSGNIGNVFTIDTQMGTVQLAKELDMNIMPEYMLQVKAIDHGKPPLSAQIPVHIMVLMADNAAPRFLKKEMAAEIFENLPLGTFVMHVEARSSSSLLFEITAGNLGDMFFINPSTGVITTKDYLDYEENKFYNLTIRATNMASKSSSCSAIIHVLDRNDNPPYFTQELYRGIVSETAPLASLVLAVNDSNQYFKDQSIPLVIKANDPDSGLNAMLHYDIVELMPRRYFHIDSTTGAIKTVMLLDHEKIPIFNFHVKVTDLGKPRLSSETTANVEIVVTDVNDCAPMFTQKEYNVTLLIPTYKNVAVIQVNATDQDSSETTTLRYDIIEGNNDGVFGIDSTTGIITTRHIDQIGTAYRLQVRVSDGKFSKVAYVNINIETSENSGLVFQKSIYEGSISENSTTITTVTVVNVLGSRLNEHIEFRILNPTDMFKIGITSGAITTTGKRFDREIEDNYELIVEARSERPDSERPRVAHVIVKITINDINDNCPMFVNLPYYAVVSVDDPRGSVITKVHALDLDSDENGEVRYEMKRGHGELFKVDRKSGEVTLKQTLESHNRDYELLIAAYDGGIPPCSTEVTVFVKVIDKSMPVFNKQFYSDTVPENIELHSPLSVAIQAESPLGRKLIYTIAKGNELEKFAVDFNTAPDSTNGPCAIYVVDELDYESQQNYELIIRATDSVSGVSAEVPVSVMVADVNDCPPEIEHDSYNITVSEGSPFGTPILKVNARDNDTGINQQITYNLQTDNKTTSEYFHMDGSEGIVYLKKSLDHETLRSHHFTVVAMDQGVPSLSSTAHVWITVLDMNDNPPKFEQPSYSCFLSEHAKRGQFVTVVTASDPDYVDHDNLIYTIAQGNEQQTYSIDPVTGIITLVNLQNFADKHMTVLNVSVTDGVYTSFTRVKINLLPANLHNPVFPHQIYDVKVNENQLPGRLVITVNAVDEDFGEYGKVTYDIFSDEMKNYFEIDSEKGEITTKVQLDRETKRVYEILVLATDGGGRPGYTTVKVSVGDMNDHSPEFYYTEYKATIGTDFTINTTILTITATDLDDNQNAAINYAIYDAQNTGVTSLIGINEHSGALYLKSNPSEMKNQLFQFFVRATDNGIPSNYADVPVDVFITSDSVPAFEQKEHNLFISESASPGTVITRFNFIPSDVNHKYKILSERDSDDPQFIITADGELRLNKRLDRETKELYNIAILAETDSSPPLTALSEINLHVQDENDNSPIFETTQYNLLLAENIEKGANILKVTARDADIGLNADIRYALVSDSVEVANTFDIDTHSGWISTLVPLDKERTNEYVFQVLGTDSGQTKHAARATVVIKLKDYNDNPPVFKLDKYETTVPEDALPGTVILHITTTDKDIDMKTPVAFYVISGDAFSQFQIRETGELFVAKPLDRESIWHYELGIIVTDGTFTALTNISVNVLDANDNPPYCVKYRYREVISEGIRPGSFVLLIQATDRDEEINSKLRFYLTGNGSDDFTLDKDVGHLKTARQLDREKQSKYQLTAHVQDREHLAWECESQLEIIITDLNDNAPKFSMESYSVALPEDAEIGTLVTKVHATDDDIGANRKIKYSFIDSYKDHFKIASDTGIITLAKPMDREMKAVYNLTVQAVDQGKPPKSTTAQLIVNVQDINDNPPEFTAKHYFASVAEESKVGQEVGRVLATSKDTGLNAEVIYSIIGGNEQKKFMINNKTGVIELADIVDYERAKDYFLTIQAMDLGEPPLSNLATINISVTDSNDNAPVFTQHSYTARIREDAQVGDKILQVHATDMDAQENGRISYSIERGDRLHQFNIEEETGYIYVASQLDRETISNYVLQIQANDNGLPILSNTVYVTVEISDANDNPPVFSEANYTTFVQEDKSPGYQLLKFEITDLDAPPNAGPYTFDFRAGNEGDAFRLEQDGILRTANRFNHRIRDSFSLQIRVFDNGTPPLYSDTWVQVKVIEESQYPPTITPLEVAINSFQDDFPGGKIGHVSASDQDKYDTLTYDLVPTAGVQYLPNTLFNISKETGTLYALPGLDIGDYRINVTVNDGKFTSSAIIKISMELITDDVLSNSVIIKFSKISSEHFILSYRKTFIRSVRNLIGSRFKKDVIIVSVQSSSSSDGNDITDVRAKRDTNSETIDVLFAVRKVQNNGNSFTYYTADEIREALQGKLDDLENQIDLTIEAVVRSKCITNHCVHGKCTDTIDYDPTSVNTISTEVISFVAVKFNHQVKCSCSIGYRGVICNEIANECAQSPCPSYKNCVPDSSAQGYHCVCPEGLSGAKCDKDIMQCTDDNCYVPTNPVSFSGKSYAHYRVEKMSAKGSLEDQLIFTLRVRTIQQTGNIMFGAGKVDYNILEIVNGIVQYRFDLGSGEGLVSVTSISISDGQWHEIRLERDGNSARLIVDGKHVAQGSAPGVNGVLNLQSNDLYLGGEVRPHPTVLGFEDIQRGFIGCMDDIRLAKALIPLHKTSGNSVAALKRFVNIEFSCDTTTLMVPLGVCGTQPCLNGGTCKDTTLQNSGTNFECICHTRYSGAFCQEDLDPCASSPCLFGGKCRPITSGNYSCECPPRMTGKRCDFGRFCSPNPCRNGGVCEEGDNGPLCMCRGYKGLTCEEDVNECENQPCGSGATCINEAGSFRCVCPPDLTGASCGDPLYSNSISTRLKNLIPNHNWLIGIIVAVCVLFGAIVFIVTACYCKKKDEKQKHRNIVKLDNCKEPLNSESVENKRRPKMNNLDVSRMRPPSALITNEQYTCNTIPIDGVRSYGQAGDDLENMLPNYLVKPSKQQCVNLNGMASSDSDTLPKQKWDATQMQTFSDNKLNNDPRRMSPIENLNYKTQTVKATGVLPGRLLNVPLPQPKMQANYDDSCTPHYTWDCSDWARRSHNTLPGITEVPGIEVPDSSSFHSNESNESHPRSKIYVAPAMEHVNPERDIETLNESDFHFDSDAERTFNQNASIPILNQIDSGSEDYRFNTADCYVRHPDSYLPNYITQSETDGESMPLTSHRNGMNTFGNSQQQQQQQILESDEEEDDDDSVIPAYGFPHRNRKRNNDIDAVMINEDESNSLLRGSMQGASHSDVSMQICEIEDSEYEQEHEPPMQQQQQPKQKSVKFANTVQTSV